MFFAKGLSFDRTGASALLSYPRNRVSLDRGADFVSGFSEPFTMVKAMRSVPESELRRRMRFPGGGMRRFRDGSLRADYIDQELLRSRSLGGYVERYGFVCMGLGRRGSGLLSSSLGGLWLKGSDFAGPEEVAQFGATAELQVSEMARRLPGLRLVSGGEQSWVLRWLDSFGGEEPDYNSEIYKEDELRVPSRAVGSSADGVSVDSGVQVVFQRFYILADFPTAVSSGLSLSSLIESYPVPLIGAAVVFPKPVEEIDAQVEKVIDDAEWQVSETMAHDAQQFARAAHVASQFKSYAPGKGYFYPTTFVLGIGASSVGELRSRCRDFEKDVNKDGVTWVRAVNQLGVREAFLGRACRELGEYRRRLHARDLAAHRFWDVGRVGHEFGRVLGADALRSSAGRPAVIFFDPTYGPAANEGSANELALGEPNSGKTTLAKISALQVHRMGGLFFSVDVSQEAEWVKMAPLFGEGVTVVDLFGGDVSFDPLRVFGSFVGKGEDTVVLRDDALSSTVDFLASVADRVWDGWVGKKFVSAAIELLDEGYCSFDGLLRIFDDVDAVGQLVGESSADVAVLRESLRGFVESPVGRLMTRSPETLDFIGRSVIMRIGSGIESSYVSAVLKLCLSFGRRFMSLNRDRFTYLVFSEARALAQTSEGSLLWRDSKDTGRRLGSGTFTDAQSIDQLGLEGLKRISTLSVGKAFNRGDAAEYWRVLGVANPDEDEIAELTVLPPGVRYFKLASGVIVKVRVYLPMDSRERALMSTTPVLDGMS